jgi:hypothetical protein
VPSVEDKLNARRYEEDESDDYTDEAKAEP